MSGDAPALGGADAAAAVAEAKLGLRIDGTGDDALLAVLARSAAAMCEAFTGQVLVARAFDQVLPASGAWTRLGRTPVRAIAGVDAVDASGTAVALDAEAYAVDIDAGGDGWVRSAEASPAAGAGQARVRVRYEAGLAANWAAAPEPLRQGIVRLAGHFHAQRDDQAIPPASVAALWRPYRRMPFGRAQDRRFR